MPEGVKPCSNAVMVASKQVYAWGSAVNMLKATLPTFCETVNDTANVAGDTVGDRVTPFAKVGVRVGFRVGDTVGLLDGNGVGALAT